MPLSKAKRYARFNVGAFMKSKKELRYDAVAQHETIKAKRKDLETVAAKRRRLENKITVAKEKVESLTKENDCLVLHPSAITSRKQSPTSDTDGNVIRGTRTVAKRRTETFEAASRIHGSTPSNNKPALVGKLMEYVKSIDIGRIGSVREDFCADEDEKVDGCYRHILEFLPLLASFYFKLAEVSKENLLWFDNEVNTFYVALGGDGAPFGKEDTAFSFLVSFLNRGKHVLSSSENFLLFGANCSESSNVVCKYVRILLHEITEIEKQTFQVSGVSVKFKFTEFPNDLKMLAFLAGELPVSAKYFSTFGNVSTNNSAKVDGTFGTSPKSTWHPWDYTKRIKMSKEVAKLKSDLEKKKILPTTRRKKVLEFLSGKGSRQEFEPLIGPFIDRAHIEPLHVKNNACQQIFREAKHVAIGRYNRNTNFSDTQHMHFKTKAVQRDIYTSESYLHVIDLI
ncbi:hypothetical protein AC249_AIPGENE18300 [Exaiptasia diaphana]|nr:hypothetical protein AC249_AIPGENE18300 [Exaiptasia diaphana]